MAVDQFLELDGIPGESVDKVHSGKIDILAWSWGLSQSGTTHVGTGSGAGKVSVNDISITKHVDKSTPNLIKAACSGKHIAKGKVIVRKAGGDSAVEYVVIELENIMVSSVSAGGSGGEESLTENVSLNFGKFKYVYTPQSSSGGGSGKVEAAWDIAKNTSA